MIIWIAPGVVVWVAALGFAVALCKAAAMPVPTGEPDKEGAEA